MNLTDDVADRIVENEERSIGVARDKQQSDKPSIAVLPFENISGDPDQEYFSDGVTEDVLTALSRIRWFFVTARNSSFSYKGTSPDIRRVASELGVRYVVEGSVRRSGNRVRVSAQLVDGLSGNQIWAERYDRELEDVFVLQDELALTLCGAIEPELAKSEQNRVRSKAPPRFSNGRMAIDLSTGAGVCTITMANAQTVANDANSKKSRRRSDLSNEASAPTGGIRTKPRRVKS